MAPARPHRSLKVRDGTGPPRQAGEEALSPRMLKPSSPNPSPHRCSQQVGLGGRAAAGPGGQLLRCPHPRAGVRAPSAGATHLQAGGSVHRLGGPEGGERVARHPKASFPPLQWVTAAQHGTAQPTAWLPRPCRCQ